MTSNNYVLVLNAHSYHLLGFVEEHRAVAMVAVGRADVHESVDGEMYRSKHLTIPRPTIVVLKEYVHAEYAESVLPEHITTRTAVLKRDAHTCIYCGNRADTIDHIWPQCRGGRTTWENTAACCRPCNAAKADRTPKEARMKLLWTPNVHDASRKIQKAIWASLMEVS